MESLAKRSLSSFNKRVDAAQIAFERNPCGTKHISNGDESLPNKLMSFTKGLKHDEVTGLLENEDHFSAFVQAINSGDPQDFKIIPIIEEHRWKSQKAHHHHVDYRAWESASAGQTYDLEGPDAQAVTMPPAPRLGSDELTAEMAEVYCQALLRDIPLSVFYGKCNDVDPKWVKKARSCVAAMSKLEYFNWAKRYGNHKGLSLENAFRGFTHGDLIGPYLSQFLLSGNNGLGNEFSAKDGMINYGAITIDQRVRRAEAINYMTNWDEYLDVQNGANFGGLEKYFGNERRFITTGRDLATYVHYDALYEAYLNACLLLLSADKDPGIPRYDEGIPYQENDRFDKQQGFAHYGGPHILTLVTEVATRALKAVRYQKFNIHRRLRPEALAARMEKKDEIIHEISGWHKHNGFHEWSRKTDLEKMHYELEDAGIFDLLRKENEKNLLLPMAFCEGSPMHPSYGAGHATVAGACVTILKAFFNHELFINIPEDGSTFKITKHPGDCAFIPTIDGSALETVPAMPMTVEDELNKLAANISIGRDWAGVHYYSDYKQSLLMGEEIAISILEEQSITYNEKENFSLTVPTFDGKKLITIKDGKRIIRTRIPEPA